MILEEANVEPIIAIRRRRLEWFRHMKRRDETENIRVVDEMKMWGKRHRGRPRLRWKDTVRRDMKAWKLEDQEGMAHRQGEMEIQGDCSER